MIDDFERSLQRSIRPSLFHHARRNLRIENINVLEYSERQLDDHAYVIRSLTLQCEALLNTSEDFFSCVTFCMKISVV